MLSSIIKNKDLISQVDVIIFRIKALYYVIPSHLIRDLEEANERVNLCHFISSKNTEYQWCEIGKDLKLSLKNNKTKDHEVIIDILLYKNFQTFVAKQIDQNKDKIGKKNMHRARRKLWRMGNRENIKIQDFDLYPDMIDSEKILAFIWSYYKYISKLDYGESDYIGQIILNEALASIVGSRGWNITGAVQNNLEEHKTHLKKLDSNLNIQTVSEFVEFILKIILQQIEDIKKMLDDKNMYTKIERYILTHNETTNTKKIPEYAILLLGELSLRGEMDRGKVDSIIGKKDRSRSNLLSQLSNHGLITSDSEKGKIRIKFGFYSLALCPME